MEYLIEFRLKDMEALGSFAAAYVALRPSLPTVLSSPTRYSV